MVTAYKSSFLNLQEVDEPLHLNMSELCLSDEFLQGNSGKRQYGVSHSEMDIVRQIECLICKMNLKMSSCNYVISFELLLVVKLIFPPS